ncbi:MAG: hypothetical protein M3P30_05550 [Chloroflexota bacterium]|nr:hypothetical protein [Chloroflexota bacterium]
MNVLRNLLPQDWSTRSEHPALGLLTIWGIDSRYPTPYAEATIDDAKEAIDQAASLYASIIRDMQQQTPPPH